MEERKSIGELLVEYGKISRQDLQEGLRLQKEMGLRLGETLVQLGKVTRDDIEWILSKQLDIPFVMVEDVAIDGGLLGKFSREFLLRNAILPLYETDEVLSVATDDPLNRNAFTAIEELTGKKIQVSASNGEIIREMLRRRLFMDGVPVLRETIEEIIARIRGTFFYRVDLLLGAHDTTVSVFGSGILKRLKVMAGTFRTDEVFETLDSLAIPFFFEEFQGEEQIFLSVYPLTNRLPDLPAQAIIGLFGLVLPEDILFADLPSHGHPNIFPARSPVFGYRYLFMKDKAAASQGSLYTPDSAPKGLGRVYVNAVIPQPCGRCSGAGCPDCGDLGYTCAKSIEGLHDAGMLQSFLDEVK